MFLSRGYLTINVTDYATNYAIEGAKISIYYIHRRTDEWELLCENLETDISGQIRKIGLYAPNIEYSEIPENEERPYSRYAIQVSKEGYEDAIISGIQVFAIIEAIQDVKLNKLGNQYSILSSYNIEEHKLYAGYQPKIIEDDTKATFVLNSVVVPEFIIVHDGLPTNKM